jgi:membrane associated rhomboid family serine protease
MQTEKRASSQGVTWGLAILFGVVGAALQQSVAGFVAGVLFGALFAQILYLRTRT